MSEREKNVIVIVSPQLFMYYEHCVTYLFRKYDTVILSTRHCRSVLEQIVNLFTKDVKFANEVGREVLKDDTLVVTLKIIGAAR